MMMICKVFLTKKSISKSKILDMVCAMRSFENINKDNKEWLQSDECEVGCQHMTDRQTLSINETKGRRRGSRG
jgi:hypothetical protein